jgi:hypothetical protein
MTSNVRDRGPGKSIGLTALVFFGLICLIDYHFSISNQIPSDGPLTIGFPMTFYWMVCPMSAASAGACHDAMSAPGMLVDLIACGVFSIVAAVVSARCLRQSFVKRRLFWINTGVILVLMFLLTSALSAWPTGSHRGRAREFGFPVAYLREYAGESWSVLNLVVDLGFCFVIAFLVAAVFSKGEIERKGH